MEQLNKVILRGHIGSVKFQAVRGSNMARFSVATNYIYKDAQGYCVIETGWHNVVAWEGDDIHNLDKLTKGDAVEVVGRLRNQRYTASDGEERYSTEILARTINVITEPLKMEE